MLLAPLALLALSTGTPAAAEDPLFRRALDRAIEQARRELIASRDLYDEHSSWDNPWVAESEHYQVRTVHSQYLAAKTAQDLEFMLRQFQDLLGTDHVPRQRYPIWIFPSLAEYNAAGGSAAEHSSFYGSFVILDQPGTPVATFETQNPKLQGMWITHSALHQFVLDAFGRTPPAWVSEGMASYFSLFWDWGWGAESLDRLIRERRYVRLSHLTQAPLASYLQNADDRFVVLGMFFNFLLHHHPDTRIAAPGEVPSSLSFREYLRAVVRGQGGRAAEFEGFLRRELDLIEAEFRGFDFPY